MWFIFAIITSLAWGGADLFYKKGSDKSERYSHLKIVIMVGLIMGVYSIGYYIFKSMSGETIEFGIMSIIKYLPVSFFYIVSMICGYFGLRYLMLSISAPIQNSSGAIVFFLFIILHPEMPNALAVTGVCLTIAGVIALGVAEKRSDNLELAKAGEIVDKKYKSSFFALIFPLLYAVLDSMGTFLDGIYLDGDSSAIREAINGHAHWIGEDEAFMAYSLTFMLCGLGCFIFVKFIKKEQYIIHREKDRAAAGALETAGQFFYVFAMAEDSMITAPLVATYCVFSVIFSRIFLKEKLSKVRLAIICIVMTGIAIIGLSENL